MTPGVSLRGRRASDTRPVWREPLPPPSGDEWVREQALTETFSSAACGLGEPSAGTGCPRRSPNVGLGHWVDPHTHGRTKGVVLRCESAAQRSFAPRGRSESGIARRAARKRLGRHEPGVRLRDRVRTSAANVGTVRTSRTLFPPGANPRRAHFLLRWLGMVGGEMPSRASQNEIRCGVMKHPATAPYSHRCRSVRFTESPGQTKGSDLRSWRRDAMDPVNRQTTEPAMLPEAPRGNVDLRMT